MVSEAHSGYKLKRSEVFHFYFHISGGQTGWISLHRFMMATVSFLYYFFAAVSENTAFIDILGHQTGNSANTV